MQSPAIYKDNKSFFAKAKGFSLVEVMVVIGIVGLVLATGSMLDIGFYGRELSSSEQSNMVAVLQKARNRSMNNIHASAHGVRIEDEYYVLYREFPYEENKSTNEKIPRNKNISVSGVTDVWFEQLSGEPNTTGEIVLSDGMKTRKVYIIKGGLIDW